jgi:hypothetical protein
MGKDCHPNGSSNAVTPRLSAPDIGAPAIGRTPFTRRPNLDSPLSRRIVARSGGNAENAVVSPILRPPGTCRLDDTGVYDAEMVFCRV